MAESDERAQFSQVKREMLAGIESIRKAMPEAAEYFEQHLARLFHDVRQEGAARALISEGNSHFGWGGMPTTVCRSQL